MEDIINNIIQIEQTAKDIADDTAAQLANLNEDIQKELNSIEEKYMQDANVKIAQIREQEHSDEAESVARLTKQYADEYEEYERLWNENSKSLEDAVFSKIVN